MNPHEKSQVSQLVEYRVRDNRIIWEVNIMKKRKNGEIEGIRRSAINPVSTTRIFNPHPSPHCGNAQSTRVSAVRIRFLATLTTLTARPIKQLGAFA